MRPGIALKWLWHLVSNLAGAAMVFIASTMGLLLLFAVVLGIARGEFLDKWPVFQWMTVLALSMLGFLNMLFFFWRLRRANPSIYYSATEGLSASAYIMSSRSAFRLLHRWVVRIATDRDLPLAEDLRLHATITRYLNVGCFLGWMSLLLAGLGLLIYLKFVGAT